MLSQSKNRVQAIKSKFENLSTETESLITRKKSANTCEKQLYKQNLEQLISYENYGNDKENTTVNPTVNNENGPESDEIHSSNEDLSIEPNSSYLYSKSDVKRSISDTKTSLTRQSSDPGKKLHRSHAFRCDRSQKLPKESPKRHGSCHGRSETSDFTLKMGEKRLSKDRLKKLGNLLEDQMRRENFKTVSKTIDNEAEESVIERGLKRDDLTPLNSIPDSDVPQHILDQYAKVLKPKKKECHDTKNDGLTDSGVSSETETQDDEKSKVKRLRSQFENELPEHPIRTNLMKLQDELSGSSETMKLEKKNPHLTLTDTLKKALKQPLPPGPPPKKPPRSFNPIATIPETQEVKRKDTREMLQKLELVLQKREAQKVNSRNVYDVAETNLSLTCEPKEMHYLCTEILDITERPLLPGQNKGDVLKNCFNSLNCAVLNNSMTSLPYTRLSTGSISDRGSLNICCSCSTDSLNVPRLSTFKQDATFKCHLKQTCDNGSKFFIKSLVDKEHIYDVPFGSQTDVKAGGRSDVGLLTLSKSLTNDYGVVNPTLNRLLSRSMEELSVTRVYEEPKIYDIPCDLSRPATPDSVHSTPKSDILQATSNADPTSDTERPKSDLERPKSNLEGRVSGFEGRKSPFEGHRGRITNFEQRKTSFEALQTEGSRNRRSVEFEGKCPEKTGDVEGRKSSFDGKKFGSCRGRISDVTEGKSPIGAIKMDAVTSKIALKKSVSGDATSNVTKSNFDRLRLNFENGKLSDAKNNTVAQLKRVDDASKRPKIDLEAADKSPSQMTDQKTDNTRTFPDLKPYKNLQKSPSKHTETAQKPPLNSEKPKPLKPKPLMVKIPSDSKLKTNASEEFKTAKKNLERKFATETKRYRKSENISGTGLALTLARRERSYQLDVDKENLNRLMNEIYDTVTVACKMDEQKPTRFPTDSDSASEDSTKLTRSLTEKRKTYVRRVSSRAAYLDPKQARRYRHQTSVCSYTPDSTYTTFRSWKSFRHSRKSIDKMAADVANMAAEFKMADLNDSTFNLTDSSGNLLSMKDELDGDNLSLDTKAGCLDFELPFEARDRGLFNVCLLVGLNYMTGEAYVKSVFPSQVKVPPLIENLVFPETISLEGDSILDYELSASKTQSYSLVLTDEKGERNYGYCRRVLPEGATACLPLCYCLISRYRAPGFYYKVLKEIESHHGSSEVEINTVLQQLFETDFPNPGESITLQYHVTTNKNFQKTAFRNSVNLGDVLKSKTLPEKLRHNYQTGNLNGENQGHNFQSGNLNGENQGHNFQSGNLNGENQRHNFQSGNLNGENQGHNFQSDNLNGENQGHNFQSGNLNGENQGHNFQSGNLNGENQRHNFQSDNLNGENQRHNFQSGNLNGENQRHNYQSDNLNGENERHNFQSDNLNAQNLRHNFQSDNLNGENQRHNFQSDNLNAENLRHNFQSDNLNGENQRHNFQSGNLNGENQRHNFKNAIRSGDKVPDFYDVENNNRLAKVTSSQSDSVRTRVLKRPIDPRVDESNMSVLLDTLGAGLLIKVFGSLLLERKVVLLGDDLSQLSSCIEALQSSLYPLVWQQPLISTLPAELRAVILQAPLPLLAGSLRANTTNTADFDEGMLIDISTTPAKVLCFQGDESTILPTTSYKTLKTTLQMESIRNLQVDRKDEKTRNVMISEAFLRFFVDILSDFWAYFTIGAMSDGDMGKGDVVFQREAFIKNASSKQNQEFLEWFTETAMFNHFVQNMAAAYHSRMKMAPLPIDYSTIEGIVDAPLPNYYEMFDGRLARSGKKNTVKTPKEKEIEGKSNYKSSVNKKVNKLKMKLKDFW